LWDVLPCKLIVDWRFRGTCCLHYPWWQLFYMAVHPRRQFWTSYLLPWELEISHEYIKFTKALKITKYSSKQSKIFTTLKNSYLYKYVWTLPNITYAMPKFEETSRTHAYQTRVPWWYVTNTSASSPTIMMANRTPTIIPTGTTDTHKKERWQNYFQS
jgi:hypothetical protein